MFPVRIGYRQMPSQPRIDRDGALGSTSTATDVPSADGNRASIAPEGPFGVRSPVVNGSPPKNGSSWASSEAVRRSMKANRRCDTGPERRLRSTLHACGYRFRKDYRVDLEDLRVHVDVAFPRDRVAVFVDGCFWHRCPEHGSDPRRNGDFWRRKLDANVERDQRVTEALVSAGWKVIRVWEHEPSEEAAGQVIAALQIAHSDQEMQCA